MFLARDLGDYWVVLVFAVWGDSYLAHVYDGLARLEDGALAMEAD